MFELISSLSFILLSFLAYNRNERINKIFSDSKIVKKLFLLVVYIYISFVWCMVLDVYPVSNGYPKTDSSIYIYMGRGMANGFIPYKDLFDHKGIILYFIEYIGYIIGHGNIYGIWIIEFVNIFITSIIFHKIAMLFSKNEIISCLSVFVTLNFCSISFFVDDGNFVEEYALPWIAISLYFSIKYFMENTYKNCNIITIGAGFAVVLLLKVNMASLWICLVIFVIIRFIKNKTYKEIIKCIILFLIGVAVVFFPVLIYLISTDSLKYMIDYYLMFNISYTKSAHGESGFLNFLSTLIYMSGITIYIIIIYSIIVNFKNKYLWINNVTLLIALLSVTISGRNYYHYAIIIIPFYIVPTSISITSVMNNIKEMSTKIRNFRVVIVISLICILGIMIYPCYSLLSLKNASNYKDDISEYIKNNTEQNSDVLVLGNYADKYLISERYTKNKFFYQYPPTEISEDLFLEFFDELKNNPSDYIIDFFSDDANNVVMKDGDNYQKIIKYLNQECQKGNYILKNNDKLKINMYVKVH